MTFPPPPQPVFPPPPPAKRRPGWLIPVIVGASVIVLGIVSIGVVGLVLIVNRAVGGPSAPDQPLVTGSEASPIAVIPLHCDLPCFTDDSIKGTLPPESEFVSFGTPDNTFPWGTYDPATAGQLFRSAEPGWRDSEGSPDTCFFAPGNSPLAASLETGDTESDDPIHFIGTWESEDGASVLDQSVRVFDDWAFAEAYMTDEADQISGCHVVTLGSGVELYAADITAAPALDIPDSMAGIGWVRTGDPGPRWRAYVIDLQRGNLIVRTRLLTDGTTTEAEFREFVERYAEQLGSLQPEG